MDAPEPTPEDGLFQSRKTIYDALLSAPIPLKHEATCPEWADGKSLCPCVQEYFRWVIQQTNAAKESLDRIIKFAVDRAIKEYQLANQRPARTPKNEQQ